MLMTMRTVTTTTAASRMALSRILSVTARTMLPTQVTGALTKIASAVDKKIDLVCIVCHTRDE
jgi:hypothetical protein